MWRISVGQVLSLVLGTQGAVSAPQFSLFVGIVFPLVLSTLTSQCPSTTSQRENIPSPGFKVASSHLVNRAYKPGPCTSGKEETGCLRVPGSPRPVPTSPVLQRSLKNCFPSLSHSPHRLRSRALSPLYYDLPPNAIDIKVLLQNTSRTSFLR